MTLLVDAHNDLLLELDARRVEENPFAANWLEKLERGGVRLQVCPAHVALEHFPEAALRRALTPPDGLAPPVWTSARARRPRRPGGLPGRRGGDQLRACRGA